MKGIEGSVKDRNGDTLTDLATRDIEFYPIFTRKSPSPTPEPSEPLLISTPPSLAPVFPSLAKSFVPSPAERLNSRHGLPRQQRHHSRPP